MKSAASSANLKRNRQPIYMDVISHGSNYGQLPFETSLGFIDPTTNREVNIGIHACGYGSVATSLQPDRVFRLSGRFLIRNSVPTPIIHFQQDTTFNIGESKNFMNSLANKVSVIGFGTVVDRNEVTSTTLGNVTSTNLHVTLQHYDYNNLAKEKIELHATYIVPGNKILGKMFIQFVFGHEIIIDAHVHGYNEDNNRWEFIVSSHHNITYHVTHPKLTITLQVGGMAHPSNQAPTPAPTPASNQSRRPGFPIASGSGSTPSSSSAQSRHEMSPLGRPDFHRGHIFNSNHPAQPPKHHVTSPTHPTRQESTEDGEVTESAASPRVGNSFGSKGPKRASELSILKEAGKRSKNLP
ncbi:hypothetical protein PGTUg99_011879 [Puccinia graminis f. sp. tritici]|uniref:Uncharacterized protein n=1 Tax=Puccinia graminis f. sp. tritici TaxID=56615 RepID=A0A5B0RJA4_PUCGR|nr:hypothetical protein PGTUg99_011879 [Puccinia graminis f. sp. tritici]